MPSPGSEPVRARRLVSLTVTECWERLRAGGVGRVGVSISALPVVLPVNYVVLGQDIVFRTAPGTKLTAAVFRSVVAFEVDRVDEDVGTAWSVVVVGLATEITDAEELRVARALPLDPWAPGGRDHFVRVRAHQISGREILVESERRGGKPEASRR